MSPQIRPTDRLAELGLSLPPLSPPVGKYLPGVRSGALLFVSGQTTTVEGRPVVTGYVGRDVSVTQARDAARLAALNALALAASAAGSLDHVRRIIRLTGYVRSAPGFSEQPSVINGASELLIEIWGAAGQHARSAIGVAELPGGAPGEIELVVEGDQ